MKEWPIWFAEQDKDAFREADEVTQNKVLKMIELSIEIQYLIAQPEELRNIFWENINQEWFKDNPKTLEEATTIYDNMVSTKTFNNRLNLEFEKEKERNSGALEYALFHCRFPGVM
jgi:hypothetical protein